MLTNRKDTQACKIIASRFIGLAVGDRIPTVSEISAEFSLSRGTVQGAEKILCNDKAIKINSRGHLGSYIESINYKLLLSYCDSDILLGVMPLPYTLRYQGLATGILAALQNDYGIETSMSYLRGSERRISLLLKNKFDYAITSYLSAMEMINKGANIKIIATLHDNSYLSNHAILFADKNKNEIEDGMIVGIDRNSVDQVTMTNYVCDGKKVEFKSVVYNQSKYLINNHIIDAIVWNIDEIQDSQIHYVELDSKFAGGNKAVVLVNKENVGIENVFKQIFKQKDVEYYQKKVLNHEMTIIN